MATQSDNVVGTSSDSFQEGNVNNNTASTEAISEREKGVKSERDLQKMLNKVWEQRAKLEKERDILQKQFNLG